MHNSFSRNLNTKGSLEKFVNKAKFGSSYMSGIIEGSTSSLVEVTGFDSTSNIVNVREGLWYALI